MRNSVILTILLLLAGSVAQAEETFVTIQKVSGNQMAIVKSGGGRGAAAQGRRGRGRRGGGAANVEPLVITVPADVKFTTAMRERRTFEFKVGSEIAGGLRHRIFQNMTTPLQARIVSEGGKITQINVLSSETDINQSNTTASGQTIIAVRPKRPPQKK